MERRPAGTRGQGFRKVSTALQRTEQPIGGGKLSSAPQGATPAELEEARQTFLEYVFPGGTNINLQKSTSEITSVSRIIVPLQKLRGTIIIESSSAKEQYGPIEPRGFELKINR